MAMDISHWAVPLPWRWAPLFRKVIPGSVSSFLRAIYLVPIDLLPNVASRLYEWLRW